MKETSVNTDYSLAETSSSECWLPSRRRYKATFDALRELFPSGSGWAALRAGAPVLIVYNISISWPRPPYISSPTGWVMGRPISQLTWRSHQRMAFHSTFAPCVTNSDGPTMDSESTVSGQHLRRCRLTKNNIKVELRVMEVQDFSHRQELGEHAWQR